MDGTHIWNNLRNGTSRKCPRNTCNGKLGDGNLYIDTLQKIVSKLEVKQLYMDVLLKTEEINFYLKGFGDSNAKLSYEAPNVSTPNPGNGKLGFKMK